jgi:hypothetical protein
MDFVGIESARWGRIVLCRLWLQRKWRPEWGLQMHFGRVVGAAKAHTGFCVR